MIEAVTFGDVLQIRMSRVLDGRPVYWVAAYLIDGLLVDTGCSHTSEELARFLDGRGLVCAVNTHYHEDHTGANHIIMERFGVEIYAHEASIPLIAQGFPLFPYQEIAWGRPVATKVKPIGASLKTRRFSFAVLDTPGHCEGHICLYEPDRNWCFTGDLFARENPKFIRPEENVGMIMASMEKLVNVSRAQLTLFTSVGKVVKDGQEALRRCIDYLSGLSRQVHDLHARGLGVEEIVNALFGGEHPFSALTNGQFSSANLVRSILETVAPL